MLVVVNKSFNFRLLYLTEAQNQRMPHPLSIPESASPPHQVIIAIPTILHFLTSVGIRGTLQNLFRWSGRVRKEIVLGAR